jgi:hypothetical protein
VRWAGNNVNFLPKREKKQSLAAIIGIIAQNFINLPVITGGVLITIKKVQGIDL